jgi:hypothetical protein
MGLLDTITGTGPQQYKAPTGKEESSHSVENGPTEGFGNCKLPPIKSPAPPDAHNITSLSPGKHVSATKAWHGFTMDSSHEFDLKNINNNVYVSKDVASKALCSQPRYTVLMSGDRQSSKLVPFHVN